MYTDTYIHIHTYIYTHLCTCIHVSMCSSLVPFSCSHLPPLPTLFMLLAACAQTCMVVAWWTMCCSAWGNAIWRCSERWWNWIGLEWQLQACIVYLSRRLQAQVWHQMEGWNHSRCSLASRKSCKTMLNASLLVITVTWLIRDARPVARQQPPAAPIGTLS